MKYIFLVFGVIGLQAQEVRGPNSGRLQDSAVWTLDQNASRMAAEGRVHRVDQAPAPEYLRGEDGAGTLLIRVRKEGAAALRAHLEDFHLPADGRLYVYGLDSRGSITRTAGPYEGAGPMESGEFWTPALPGGEIVLELQTVSEPGSLPFTLQEVGVLDGIEEGNWLAERSRPLETRVSMYRGIPVEHHVVDGYGVWEGDILLGRVEELERYEGGKAAERQAFAISGSSYRWPGGVVPYTIDSTIPTPTRITDAIAHWNSNLSGTIQLVPRTNESVYISFVRASSAGTCSSYVGRIGMAGQPVNIGDYCSTGNVIHEVGHSIGLYHEHTRTDRDSFVKVNMQNVTTSAASNFYVVSSGLNVGSYDYGSIMHYSAYAFSANGLPTIETIPAGIAIGQRNGLSSGDVAGVRSLYSGSTPPPPSPTTVNVTITSNPTGLTMLVDGASVVTPVTRTWTSGSSHTVSAPDNTTASAKYVFQSWSDGGAQTHTVTAPTSNATLSAAYRTRYLLKKSASDPVKGNVSSSPASADGYYDLNSTVVVSAAAFSGSCFTSWSGILNVADFSAQLTMNRSYDVMGMFQTGSVTFPTTVTAPQGGGVMSVSISAASGCLWKASSSTNWITVQTPSGTSGGVLKLKLSKNNSKNARTGTVVVNGVTMTVTQSGR